MRLKILLAVLVLMISTLACGGEGAPTRRPLNLYPTETPNATQTPIIMEVVETQVILVEITPTPLLPTEITPVERICVRALTAVYLRPSPSKDNYPIMALPFGAELTDLGGRDGNWRFVQYQDKSGWVHGIYTAQCPS